MPLTRTLRSRGSTVVVTAFAENLFTEAGPIPSWTRRATTSIRKATRTAAPTNQRHRWAHQGTPLKNTFRGSTRANPAGLKTYFAVGSTSDHALFVDQGTTGGFPMKILPPWAPGSPSLFESSWNWFGKGTAKNRKTNPGQRPQNFFDTGLRNGLAAMGIPTVEGATPDSLRAGATFPEAVAAFTTSGGERYTQSNPVFRAQLAEWRAWRDSTYNARNSVYARQRRAAIRAERDFLRDTPGRAAALLAERRQRAAEASKAYRDRNRARINAKRAQERAKSRAKEKAKTSATAVSERNAAKARVDFMQRIISKYPAARGFQVGTPQRVRVPGTNQWQWSVKIRRRDGSTFEQYSPTKWT